MLRNILVSDKILLFLCWLTVGIAIAFSKEQPGLQLGEVIYMVHRGVLAILIVYGLFPKFYSQGRHLSFLGYTLLALIAFGAVEEVFIEKTFLYEMRGQDDLNLWGLYVFCVETVPMLALMLFAKVLFEHNENQKKIYQLKLEKTDHELLFLRAQINPHFLFNILNNIYSYSLEKSSKTPDMILTLSDLLRYMLYECTEDKVLLSDELKYIQDYIRLQEMGLENRGAVSFKLTGVPGTWSIPPFILIVFVENSFKHSLSSMTSGVNIEIHAAIESQSLHFSVRNQTNVNPNIQQPEALNGVGLSNVRRRLELIYGNAFELNVGPSKDLYETHLKIPFLETSPLSLRPTVNSREVLQ